MREGYEYIHNVNLRFARSTHRCLLRPRRARRPLPAPRLRAGPHVRWWSLRGRWLRIDDIGVLIVLLLKMIAQMPMPCLGCASGIFLLHAGACCHRTCAIWVARTPLRAMWRCPCSCVACCLFCFILRQLWRPSRRLHRTCPCTARCCRCGASDRGRVASTLLEVLHANATRRSPRASTVRDFLALLLLPSASDLPLVGARAMTVLVAHVVACRQEDLRSAGTPGGLRTMLRRHAGTAAQDLDALALAGIGARTAADALVALPCAAAAAAAAQRTTWLPAMSTVSATLPMFAGGRALRLCLLDVRLSCVCCVLCPVHLMAP